MAVLSRAITQFVIGDYLTIDHLITEMPSLVQSATLTIKQRRYDTTPTVGSWTITTTPSGAGAVLNPGVLQGDGSYTADIQFTLAGDPNGDTSNWAPGLTLWASVTAYPGPYTSELFPIVPLIGGRNG